MQEEDWIARAVAGLIAGFVGILTWVGARQVKRIDSHDSDLDGIRKAVQNLDRDMRDRMDKQRDRDLALSKELRDEMSILGSKVDTNHAAVIAILMAQNSRHDSP